MAHQHGAYPIVVLCLREQESCARRFITMDVGSNSNFKVQYPVLVKQIGERWGQAGTGMEIRALTPQMQTTAIVPNEFQVQEFGHVSCSLIVFTWSLYIKARPLFASSALFDSKGLVRAIYKHMQALDTCD